LGDTILRLQCSPCAQTLDRLAGRLPDDVGDGRLTLLLEQRMTLMQAQALEAEVSSILGVLSVAVYRNERHVVIKVSSGCFCALTTMLYDPAAPAITSTLFCS